MSTIDITEVARTAGIPASAIRFYEEKRLIKSVGRRGLRRLFEPAVLERIALIGLGRAAGFSLDEIARMFAADGRPRIDRHLLTAKADELDKTIKKLTKMRDGLRHAAACPAPRHTECPTFQRLLRAIRRSRPAFGPPTDRLPSAIRNQIDSAPKRLSRIQDGTALAATAGSPRPKRLGRRA